MLCSIYKMFENQVNQAQSWQENEYKEKYSFDLSSESGSFDLKYLSNYFFPSLVFEHQFRRHGGIVALMFYAVVFVRFAKNSSFFTQ